MATKAIGLKIPFQLGNNGYFETNTDTMSQISSNIQNLLLTKPGERRFNNSFGSSLYKFLFEDFGDLDSAKQMVLTIVQNDVDKFLNGVLVTDVSVEFSSEQPINNDYNKIFISVQFSYKDVSGQTSVVINNNNL